MNSTIEKIISRTTNWTRPTFDAPFQIGADELTLIGTDGSGRRWHTHAKFGELRERPRLLDDQRDVLPDGPIIAVREDGKRRYRTFDVLAPGTYASTTATIERAAKPVVMRRLDAAVGMPLLGATRFDRLTFADHLATLRRKGYTLSPSTVPGRPIIEGERTGAGIREVLAALGEELDAELRGERIPCEAPAHEGTDPARAKGLAGARLCAMCMWGRAA